MSADKDSIKLGTDGTDYHLCQWGKEIPIMIDDFKNQRRWRALYFSVFASVFFGSLLAIGVYIFTTGEEVGSVRTNMSHIESQQITNVSDIRQIRSDGLERERQVSRDLEKMSGSLGRIEGKLETLNQRVEDLRLPRRR